MNAKSTTKTTTRNATKALVAAGLIVAGLGMGAAQAASGSAPTDAQDKTEMQSALSAKTSLVDAVKAAQAQVNGGKAMEVVFSDENGQPGYEVSLVAPDGSEHNLFVDAASGKARQATAAAENENDDHTGVDDSEEGEAD